MRGSAGASQRNTDVTVGDPRRHNLRELLLDFSRPGLCLVLGSGASHGVVPMSRDQIAAIAREVIDASGQYWRLPGTYQDQLQDPSVRYLTDVLVRTSRDNWDKRLDQFFSPGQARFVLGAVFTPRQEVPRALVRIYDVLENLNGAIVSYNYDRITDRQTRFPVIAPHGQRAQLFDDPQAYAEANRLAWEFHVTPPSEFWLPEPESERVRVRYEYQRALRAWGAASAIVFIGYAFGRGDDGLSFEDFADHASRTARVHVLGPRPDNADLTRQVAHACRGRKRGFRVFSQPFRWRELSEALLQFMDSRRASRVIAAVGHEVEIGMRHDWIVDPRTRRKGRRMTWPPNSAAAPDEARVTILVT